MKKSYSLSFIVIILALFSFLLIVIPLSYVSYSNFEKTLNENISTYLKQLQNNTQTLFEHETFVIENKALEISTIISNVGMSAIGSVNMHDDHFSNEIDLLFVLEGEKILNFSESLYDTDLIITKILEMYDVKKEVHNLVINGKIYSLLMKSKEIINEQSGRIEGQVFVGKILNENIGFIKKIKEKLNIEALSFYVDNTLIASTYDMPNEKRKVLSDISAFMDNKEIHTQNKKIYSKFPLSCNDAVTGVTVVPVIKSESFDILKENNIKQIVGWIFFFALINLVIFLLVNKYIVSPLKKLLDFANNIKETKSHDYEKSIISEYNLMANGLKDIISQLRDVKEQYALAIEGTQDGLWDWNIKEKEIYFSARSKELFGFSQDWQISLESWKDFIHPDDKRHFEAVLVEHLKQELPVFEVEFRVKCKDGNYKWLKAKAKALFTQEGFAYRMLGFFSDIDVLKKLEEENQQKEAYILEQSKMTAMGDMLSNIAHQWRQPLSMITTVVSGIKVTLELDLFDKEDIIKDLDVVNKTSQELSKTIDSFRETYEFGHQKEDFNIKKLILKDLQMLEPAYSYQNIVFVANLQEQEFFGYKDEFLLVFNKLLQNAKDALLRNETKEGLIFIDLVTHMNKVTVSVRDNAGGVDEEISDKIFEPYFTTKHQSQGVGLSLYMSRNIISKYFQGDLLFKNVSYSYENKTYDGAEFKITFPLPL